MFTKYFGPGGSLSPKPRAVLALCAGVREAMLAPSMEGVERAEEREELPDEEEGRARELRTRRAR